MKRYSTELIFMCRIMTDGGGVDEVNQEKMENLSFPSHTFDLQVLSISNGTFIASGMATYVVKLKNPPRK